MSTQIEPTKSKPLDLSPAIWHLEDGTPIYMYSIAQYEALRDKYRVRPLGRQKNNSLQTLPGSGGHAAHKHIAYA